MDLPHLNVLTKIDNLSNYDSLPFNLDYYAEVQDLSYLLPLLTKESPMFNNPKFEKLNTAIIELVEDFGLVGFETLAVEDKKSMMKLLQAIDRAGGYVFGGAEGANDNVWQVAMREGGTTMDIKDVQERWLDAREEYDELERRELEAEAEELRRRSAAPDHDDAGEKKMEEDDDAMEQPPPPSSARPTGGSGVRVIRKKVASDLT